MKAHGGTEIFEVLGQRMLALYHRPAGPEGKRFPAVLFLHGFPGSEKSVDLQRALMARGIASVAPHFLGAWGSGGRYRFTTLVAQARAALRAVKTLPFVDPKRVAVYGFSMGGWTALNLAADEPDLKAVAAIAPVGGPEMVGPQNTDFIRRLSRPLNTLPLKALTRDFARAVSTQDPARAAARMKAPLLLVHGDADATIPLLISRRILGSAGKKARLVVEKGGTHDFLDRRAKLTRLCASYFARRLSALVLLLACAAPLTAQDLAFETALETSRAGFARDAGFLRAWFAPSTPEQARALIVAKAEAIGVPRAYVEAALDEPRLKTIPGLEDRFGKPAETLPYERYREIFLTEKRIQGGADFLAARRATLDAVAARKGVDPALLTALSGVETFYGANTGSYATLSALWTITQKVPARSSWAAREAAELLKLCRAQGQDAHAVSGSYAGAIGLVQFMPSSLNAYGADFDGDGRSRWDEWPDALLSAANYLARHGYSGTVYEPSSPIGRAIYAYNHSDNYVRVVLELRAAILARAVPPAP